MGSLSDQKIFPIHILFSQAFEFPEVAGLPIGGNVSDFFYRLEVHYNNANKSAGQSAPWFLIVKYHFKVLGIIKHYIIFSLHRSS